MTIHGRDTGAYIVQYGTNAERLALASPGVLPLTEFHETDTGLEYKWFGAWVAKTAIASESVNIASLSYPSSLANNSTAQLAAAASFTGGVETVLSLQSAQIEIVCDQPYTYTINSFIDVAGLQLSGSITDSKAASVPTNINTVLPGNYFQLIVTNTGGSTTTTLAINTTFGIMNGVDDKGNMPVITPLAAPYCPQQVVTASAVALPAKRMLNGAVITASASNTGAVMVGPTGVAATDNGTGNGYKLLPGQSTAVACRDLSQVFVIGGPLWVATDFVYTSGN